MKTYRSPGLAWLALLVSFPIAGMAEETNCSKVWSLVGKGITYTMASTHLPVVFFAHYHSLRRFGPELSRRQAARQAFRETKHLLPGAILAGLFNLAYFSDFTESQFIAATPSFDVWGDDECLIVANFHTEEDPHRAANRRLYEKRYGGSKKCTRYIEVTSFEQMLSQLTEIKSVTKKNIGRLQINAHGSPGSVGGLSLVTLADFKERGIEVPADLFAAKAEIRIVSCATGRGEPGGAFTRELGKALLKHRGGTVWSANPVLMNYEVGANNLKPVGRALKVSFPAEAFLGEALYAIYLLQEYESQFPYLLDPVRRTEISPEIQ